ncbi:secreted RxLR effector protein 161-like [Bidens hawaiensis]|uniref:secreted RxLR effector protein 161-like n=1 Tax=Bidens hawaiensis TaxID=980011 RepID=UPI00404A5B22
MAYYVDIVSRYMQSPRESHGMAIRHLLRYLKKTTSYGIKYGKNGSKRLVGYSDSSHNIDKDDGRSTTGHVFYYGQSPITWCSQKQATVALSSCEAEYMAALAAACQAVWLRELLSELTGEALQKVMLKVDNTSAIALVKNSVFNNRTKHIKSRFHFIRDCYNDGEVDVEHISGKEQRADILTKALVRIKFMEMHELLGVEDLTNPNQKLGG